MVLAIFSILALATPAMAQQEGFFFKSTQTGTAAFAQWGECTPDTPEPDLQTCDFTSVNVMDGSVRFSSDLEQPSRTGSQACVNHELSIQGPDSYELLSLQSGCTDTFALTVAADLTSAHLVATVPVFELECDDEFNCEPVGDPIDTAVDVTWTVEGVQAVREQGNFHSLQNGLCATANSRVAASVASLPLRVPWAGSTSDRQSSPTSSPASRSSAIGATNPPVIEPQ